MVGGLDGVADNLGRVLMFLMVPSLCTQGGVSRRGGDEDFCSFTFK